MKMKTNMNEENDILLRKERSELHKIEKQREKNKEKLQRVDNVEKLRNFIFGKSTENPLA